MEILVFFFLFFLLFLGVPVASTLFLCSLIGFSFIKGIPLIVLAQDIITKLDNFVFLAVLFFIYVGNLMASGQMADRIIRLSRTLFGWLDGGLAISGIIACALFGAICGSGTATIIAVGGIVVPSLIKSGYGNYFSVGIIGASGTLGMIIPPSVPMIIYAVIAGISIDKMFAAGYLPSLLIMASFGLYSFYIAKKQNIEKAAFPTAKEVISSIKDSLLPLLLILIIFGGIYSGIFSATEAGAVAVAFALFVELVVYRSIGLKGFMEISVSAGVSTGIVMLIIGTAATFADYLVTSQLPIRLAEAVLANISSKFVLVLLVNLFLLIMGTFLEIASAIIIFVPLLLPLIENFGIDPLHFGIIFIVNLCIGYITPPIGMSLYVSCGMFPETRFELLVKAMVPLFFIFLFDLLLISYIPWLSLALPSLFK
jgi:tripartite ATP-independent transporter DctM subunit